MTSTDLVQTVGDDDFQFLQLARPPAQVLEEARQAAAAIADVISKKAKPVIMNGEQYLELEDWQTVGRFYGITAEVEWTRYCEFGGARGFEARAVAKHSLSGRIVSAAENMCLNDEPKWSARPKYEWQDELDAEGKAIWFEKDGKKLKKGKRVQVGEDPVPLAQIRSMAQTRACAKALRNVLAWVVVLAGYKATPAEELETERDGNGGHRVDGETKPPAKKAAPPAGAGTSVRVRVKDLAFKDGQGPKGPWRKMTLTGSDGQKYGSFDSAHAATAQEAQQGGDEVDVVYAESKYGRDLVALTLVAREPGAEG